ncbi:MAG: DUF87 domain-containing protein [Candidatus Micrarchaeia archaeon]
MKELDFRKLHKEDTAGLEAVMRKNCSKFEYAAGRSIADEKEGKYSEIQFYSNKINKKDWENFFKILITQDVPFFDSLNLSMVVPRNSIELVIKKNANTIRIYLKNQGKIQQDISSLIFPLKLKERCNIYKEGGFALGLKIIRSLDLFSFLVKEDVNEISLSIRPFLGRYLGIAKSTNTDGSKKIMFLTNPAKFLEINLESNPSFYMELIDKPLLKSVYIDSEEPIFESKGIRIGIDNFDALKHSLIVGMSGSGKSKFIYILSRAIKRKYGRNAKIILIDPQGEFSKMMEKDATIIDFKNKYIEPLEVGKSDSPMTTQLVEDLIMSIIGEKNKYADRVLFYSIHLLSSIGKLDLITLSKLLTDGPARMQYLNESKNEEVKRFFSTEFDDIYMNHFNDAVLPILNFVGEYELYMGKKSKAVSLLETIEKSEILVISFDPHFFGRKMIKFLAGAVIQQMYILAITEKFKDPHILIVDEFPIVENSVVKNIHAETRKFNLHLYLSMQYLNQLKKDITDSILTNVYNYIIFKCNRKDASIISSMMDIKVEEYFKKQRQPSELEEEKKDLFVNLLAQECVVRLFDGNKHLMPMRVKVTDIKKWKNLELPYLLEVAKPIEKCNLSEFKKDDYELIR